MEIQELLAMQKRFDMERGGKIDFYADLTDDNVDILEHLLVCLIGEVGEMANIAKKVRRGDFRLNEARSDFEGELVDTFIYVIKLINQMGVDIETAYVDKLRENETRFKRYERHSKRK